MKFDYILGNPPYQYSKGASTSNKLYIDITKKALDLLKKDGTIDFITPTTIVQSKIYGFSLSGMKGLKLVDYTVDEQFNVGVRVLRWKLSKSYDGEVTLINKDGTIEHRDVEQSLVDYKDRVKYNLFEKIKKNKDKLFILDQTTSSNNKQETKDLEFFIPVNINKNKNKVEYTRKTPKLYKKKKIAISVSSSYKLENIFIDKEDYAKLYYCIDVEHYTEKQIQNTLDFLFHPLTVAITSKYKLLYGVGINAILYSFPKIDINKEYKEQDIIEEFNLTPDELKYLKE